MLVGRTFAQNRLAIVGVAVVVLVTLFSFVGPLLYHTDQFNPDLLACQPAAGRRSPARAPTRVASTSSAG